MRNMSEKHTLYKIDIQTPVSPSELDTFTSILEESGYKVVTDLEQGAIEVHAEAEGYANE